MLKRVMGVGPLMEIEFDEPKWIAFKKAINQAIKQKAETFQFENKAFLVAYARYLVEYVDERLNDRRRG